MAAPHHAGIDARHNKGSDPGFGDGIINDLLQVRHIRSREFRVRIQRVGAGNVTCISPILAGLLQNGQHAVKSSSTKSTLRHFQPHADVLGELAIFGVDLFLQKIHPHIRGNGVEATAMYNFELLLSCFVMVLIDHLPHPTRFPAQIAIVGARFYTSFHQQAAVLGVRANGGTNHLALGRHGQQGVFVKTIGKDDRDLG